MKRKSGNSESNAMRTMVVYKVVFNERNNPENKYYAEDVNGNSAVDLFDKFCNRYTKQVISGENSIKHIIINRCLETEQGLLIYLQSGSSGENGEIVNLETAKTDYSYNAEQSSMVNTRAYLHSDYGYQFALLCVEHSSSAAGDTILFKPFRNYLSILDHNVVVAFERVVEEEALDIYNSVDKVVVKRYLGLEDSSDALVREGDCITTTLTHKRNHPFSMALFERIVRAKGKEATLLGIDPETVDSNKATVSVMFKGPHNRKATFILGGAFESKVREILNENGQRVLSDEEFIRRCEERCRIIQERIGRMLE